MKPLRERVLDAAFETTTQRGWQAVTMAQVGQVAGVSRQSVYNEFGNKRALAEALVTREVGLFLDAVDHELLSGPTPADAGVAATNRVFAMAAVNPLLHSVLSAAGGGDSELLPLITSESRPLIDAAVQRVCASLRSRFGDFDPDLDVLVDAVVRVVLSRLIQPGDEDARSVEVMVRRLL